MQYAEELKEIIRNDDFFMKILRSIRDLNLESWCVGAGIIRNTVWAHLHSYPAMKPKDIDVAYFDSAGKIEDELEYEKILQETEPDIPWDVKNQALVHAWYHKKFGFKVEPFTSLEEAIAAWPETVTSVAVYLDKEDNIRIIAPLGLDDLFNIVLRRNPARVTPEQFLKRLSEKDLVKKWPMMRVVMD